MSEVRFPPMQIPPSGEVTFRSLAPEARGHRARRECENCHQLPLDILAEPSRLCHAGMPTPSAGAPPQHDAAEFLADRELIIGPETGAGKNRRQLFSYKKEQKTHRQFPTASCNTMCHRRTLGETSRGNVNSLGIVNRPSTIDDDPQPPIPEGGDPKPPSYLYKKWPFKFDCTPPYKAVPCYIAKNYCTLGLGQSVPIVAAHLSAYKVALTARRTLAYIRQLYLDGEETLAKLLWNWGGGGGETSAWTHNNLWGGSLDSRYASLSYWFGHFSTISLARILFLFSEIVAYYEKGAVNAIAGNHPTYERDWVTYVCTNSTVYVGMHAVQRYTNLGLGFFYPEHSHRYRTAIILHENMHHLLGVDHPNDETNYESCSGYPLGKCYIPVDNNWKMKGGNPRNLVVSGKIWEALDNIDNHMAWAVRRWADPQFGECHGPRPPVGWVDQ